MSITLQITDNVREALKGLKPELQLGAIARGMRTGADYMVGQITRDRLTGQGPFPVEDHRLGVVTGRLRLALRATGPDIEGNTVIMRIGDPVEYAAVHEFGFIGVVNVPAHTRETKSGEVGVKAHTRNMNVPARAPIGTGVDENLSLMSDAIGDEIIQTMKGDGS